MKGLLHGIPTEDELARLYHELGRIGAPSVGERRPWRYEVDTEESLFVLASEMLRYDPRLLSILLELLIKRWRSLNPVVLRQEMRRMRWPQALLVVVEFARAAIDDEEFRYYADHLASGFKKLVPEERFFFDMERLGSRTAMRRAGRNLAAYGRWGFIALERPTTSAVTKKTVGRYDAGTRARIRRTLAERHESFTMAEYLDALESDVSRQQAYQDLRSDPSLEVVGHGRGARWQLKSA